MRLPRFLLPAALAVALPACDTGGPETVTFQDVEVEAVGGADVRVDGDRLVVTGVGASGEAGIGIWQGQSSTDLKFEPIDLPDDGAFGVEVRATDDSFIASIESEADGTGRHDIVFDIAPRFGIETVTLEYLLQGELLVSIPNFPALGGGALKASLGASGAGKGEGSNGSVRVVRVGGRYVVGQDYSEEEAQVTGGEASGARGECPFAVITLPVPVGDITEVCADLVQVVVEDRELPSAIRGTAITGRNLGSFVVTDLRVE